MGSHDIDFDIERTRIVARSTERATHTPRTSGNRDGSRKSEFATAGIIEVDREVEPDSKLRVTPVPMREVRP